jgi:hypothetical protein
MRQEDPMITHQPPLIIKPAVYELPGLPWGWCRLHDICCAVRDIHLRRFNIIFDPTPEQLVRSFAALIERNKKTWQRDVPVGALGIKYFRFSDDGIGFKATAVPDGHLPKNFRLDTTTPYPDPLYVPEGWMIEVTKAVRKGAVQAWEPRDGIIIGLPHEERKANLFILADPQGRVTNAHLM